MNSRVCVVLLAGFVYLLLVSGGVIPYSNGDIAKAAAKGGMLAVAIFVVPLGSLRRSSVHTIAWFLLIGLALMCVGLYRASELPFALEKIDGAILCASIAALLVARGYATYGEERFQVAFLLCASLILVATVLYKLQFGFFDRQTKFLLNGPIVYGWLMGFCALLAFHLWSTSRKKLWIFCFVAFSCALLWTESKGSTVAFAISLLAYILASPRRNFKLIVLTALVGVFAYYYVFEIFADLFLASRFSAVARLLTGAMTDVDDGSVGIRSLLSKEAIENFVAHPVLGIGLGQFSFDFFVYPHNQHLEIFAELGVVAGIAHAVFIATALLRSNTLNRSIILLFSVASAFSGDASYLRFLYTFCLLSFLYTTDEKNRPREVE